MLAPLPPRKPAPGPYSTPFFLFFRFPPSSPPREAIKIYSPRNMYIKYRSDQNNTYLLLLTLDQEKDDKKATDSFIHTTT